MEETINQEDFKKILTSQYSNQEAVTLVRCLMSANITHLDSVKCLAALGKNLELSQDMNLEVTEIDEVDGEEYVYKTSIFQMFVDASVDSLLYEKDSKKWVIFYRDYLLELEEYELLNTLKLEKTWKI